jgi:hypothetical protein
MGTPNIKRNQTLDQCSRQNKRERERDGLRQHSFYFVHKVDTGYHVIYYYVWALTLIVVHVDVVRLCL